MDNKLGKRNLKVLLKFNYESKIVKPRELLGFELGGAGV